MKTENIDAMIREALDEEDLDYFDFEEPSVPEKVTSLFQGRGRWLNVMAFILVFVLFLAAVYCGIRFFESDDVATMLRWGSVAGLCWFATGFVKLWTWMEMERFAVVREIKRLELQVANLAARLRNDSRQT